jgi:hypothetical protein
MAVHAEIFDNVSEILRVCSAVYSALFVVAKAVFLILTTNRLKINGKTTYF